MLATLPLPIASNTSPNVIKRYWPLSETQEQAMTIAAAEQEAKSMWRQSLTRRSRSSAVRCDSCHRKFHSVGNLANHQQLYNH